MSRCRFNPKAWATFAGRGRGGERRHAPVLVVLIIGLIVVQSLVGRAAVEGLSAALSPGTTTILSIGVLVAVVAVAFWISASKLICAGLAVVFLLAGLLVWTEVLFAVEVIHILTFGLLGTVVAGLGVRTAIAVLVVTAIGDEALQYVLPMRVGDVRDVMLNLVSGMLGLGLVRLSTKLAMEPIKSMDLDD